MNQRLAHREFIANAQAQPHTRQIVITDWKPFERNTLRGFFSVTLPSGLVIHDCSLHEKGSSRWINFPSQIYTGKDGSTNYKPFLEFRDRKTSVNFRDQVLRALDQQVKK